MTKKRGSRKPVMKSCSLSTRLAARGPGGKNKPKTNAPKVGCTPMQSVMKPKIITPARMVDVVKLLKLSSSGVLLIANHAIPGRTTKKQKTTYTVLLRITQMLVLKAVCVSAKEMANTKRVDPKISLKRAAGLAILPISVSRSLSSARTRAITGSAVVEREREKKIINVSCRMVVLSCRRKEKAQPMRKGKKIPEMAKSKPFFPFFRMTERSISSPTMKAK
ncbi:Cation/H(+) antiporter like [Actinidia chinensis var. chinensis]|uniref:Cation/H(+) antiporter like n=1 Tax=Actinidia chinensis var. chinensis TaxID=1590841 RepID=A0A2R6R6C7_ACTCC|nr:Cation/H(+) antiporter like [Actinidia chinensis var. chinensis]